MYRRLPPLLWILLLALALRLVNLGGRSLWYDEAFAVLFASKGLSAMLYGTLTPVAGGASDIHPLLYYTLLNIWMAIFGQSAFAVRLLSVLFGTATVAVIYYLARELFGQKPAIGAGIIVAVAPFHVQYSQETRMYALLGLLLAGATFCFVKGWQLNLNRREEAPNNVGTLGTSKQISMLRANQLGGLIPPVLKQEGRGWWIAFGVLAALAMYTQQLAAFYLIALGLVPILTRRWDKLRSVMLAAVLALIIYFPWLIQLPAQFQKVRSYYWIDPPNIGTLLRTAYSFMVVNLDIPRATFSTGLILALILLIFTVVQLIFYWRSRRIPADRQPLQFVLWMAAAPVGLMWLVSQFQPVYLERSLLPAALMLYILLAWVFTRGGLPRPIAYVLGALCVSMAGIGLYYQYTWATFPNSPFPQALAYVRQNWQDGDIIVHQNKLTALPSVYMDRELPQRYLGDRPGSSEDTLALPTQQSLDLLADACIQSASQDAERVWWVIFDFAEQQYAQAGRKEFSDVLDWLNTHYTKTSEQQFNDLDVILFTDPHGDRESDCPVS